ncbi:MAG: biopolymer transporter ExbD [Rhodobacteraceae bacterium]|nr:biopolymer transporter ExbD [Paracoccaceae bacterium]QEW19741.1 putative ExbD-like biopolymer transporter [Marinibacterium anthonyi]
MAGPTLTRPSRPKALISLVPMIDVMLILLVFFMVTSTYLDLDMIPAARRGAAQADAPTATEGDGAGAGTLMIRLGADGVPVLRGQRMDAQALSDRLSAQVADAPLTQVLILPSAAATTQALVSVMEIATQAGITRLRVIRLEARP